MWLAQRVDRPTATETIGAAREIEGSGVAIALGTALIIRSGVAVVAAVHDLGRVFVDARLSGDPREVMVAGRHLASAGASWVTVDGRLDPDHLATAGAALAPYGTRVVVVVVPPEANDAALARFSGDRGRGRILSKVAASLSAVDVDVMTDLAGIGVAAQVAPSLGTVVAGLATGEIAEARERGAAGAILSSDESIDATEMARLSEIAGTD